jgi:hypothetical protein
MRLKIAANGNSDNAVIYREDPFSKNQKINDYIYMVFIDSEKKVWFGTDVSGVFCYDKNILKNITKTEGAVHSFTEDKKGRIWFSVADAGLRYIENDSIKTFHTIDGLSDPSPSSLITSYEGNIIVVHDNGFDVIDPETREVIYHSTEENLADINSDLNTACLSTDSIIWIGTEKGIIRYEPAADMKLKKPPLVMRTVTVFTNYIDFKKKNEFSSEENNFRFDYDGLWYTDPQRINYQFLLDGYSTKWQFTKDHFVTFPRLPPGQYNFKLKASLNSNFENASEVNYLFVINPPVWQRWWFRILSALVIALIIFFIVRKREERLRKFDRLQKEKIEFQFETLKSQVNPHFLFNSFNTLITVIENSPKLAVEYVERLSEFFRNIVTFRDKNLITISEEINFLENYIFIQKKRFGENLQLKIILETDILKRKFIAPLTLQMLAENAIKHNSISHESPLEISISIEADKLKITNNINPKIVKEKSAGFGLENIKSRYRLLTDEEVIIMKMNNNFTVLIPILNSKYEPVNS